MALIQLLTMKATPSPLVEITSSGVNPDGDVGQECDQLALMCTEHKKPVEALCWNEKKPVCIDCLLLVHTHKAHQVHTIQGSADKLLLMLQEQLTSLQTLSSQMSGHERDTLDKSKIVLAKDREIKRVTDFYSAIRKAVD